MNDKEKYKIGLEIHVQLKTDKKLFTSAIFDASANQNTCIADYDISMPGTYPHINSDSIKQGIKAAMLLNCEVAKKLTFDRKHYFYPDLPSGYQVTQQENPIGRNGYFLLFNNKKITIDNVHIECDAGKTKKYGKKTIVDFNRCGVALVEIVTNPDFESVEEVETFLTILIADLRKNGISNANMEEGNFRVDVNISRILNDEKTSCRYEIKNLNSFRSIKYAVKLTKEKLVGKTDKDKSMTIFYNSVENTISEGRIKEGCLGYMYMIEPSLYPVDTCLYNEDSENIKIDFTIEKANELLKLDEKADLNLILKICCSNQLMAVYNLVMATNCKIELKSLLSLISNFSDDVIFCINEEGEGCEKIKFLIDGIILLSQQKVLKVDVQKAIELSFSDEMKDSKSIEEYLIKNNLIIEDSFDESLIIKFIESSEELKEAVFRSNNGDSKAISFLIGKLRKEFKEVHPNKIKQIISKL